MHRFLGTVDIYGTPFEASFVATGMAAYLIKPLMAKVDLYFYYFIYLLICEFWFIFF